MPRPMGVEVHLSIGVGNKQEPGRSRTEEVIIIDPSGACRWCSEASR